MNVFQVFQMPFDSSIVYLIKYLLLYFISSFVTFLIKLTGCYNTTPLVAHDVHRAAAKQGKSNNVWNI